jgi:catechol 2,3-dioxygenase-like lactoylglutathione lyase family enzyme
VHRVVDGASTTRQAVTRRLSSSVMAPGINHVSVNARDLGESVDFYLDVLGAEPIPTPNFGVPVQWLALGRTQLHLFERDLQPTSHHHFAVAVDDLEPVYRAAARRGAFDMTAFGNHLVELPGDVVQLYLRDPGGNLVEIDNMASTGCLTTCARCSRAFGICTRRTTRTCAGDCSCPNSGRPRRDGQS